MIIQEHSSSNIDSFSQTTCEKIVFIDYVGSISSSKKNKGKRYLTYIYINNLILSFNYDEWTHIECRSPVS